MTPIATPVNAVSYASFPGVSLKRMLGLGFILNIVAGAFFSFLIFFLLNVIRF
jgi:di/tricarboxylate transporter